MEKDLSIEHVQKEMSENTINENRKAISDLKVEIKAKDSTLKGKEEELMAIKEISIHREVEIKVLLEKKEYLTKDIISMDSNLQQKEL